MKRYALIIFAVLLTFAVGCSTVVRRERDERGHGGGGEISETITIDNETIESLEKQWEYEYITANGSAPVVPKYDDPARDKELARRGAILDAKRNLAEKISATRLTETVTMSDLVVTDFVHAQLDAELENVEVIHEEYDEANGICRASVRMPKLRVLRVVEEYIKHP